MDGTTSMTNPAARTVGGGVPEGTPLARVRVGSLRLLRFAPDSCAGGTANFANFGHSVTSRPRSTHNWQMEAL
jgi:hypothetical protein